MVNLARMIKNQGELDTVICPRVTGTGCLTRNKETPIIFLWKVTLKLTVPSSGASGSPLEIASLPSPALWLKVWWVILGTSFPFLLLGHLVEHGILFSFGAKPLVLWPRAAGGRGVGGGALAMHRGNGTKSRSVMVYESGPRKGEHVSHHGQCNLSAGL